ncbi:Detected protein of unknown function [Hibiscus syriacus]|uniref:Uncharacterized protein n=1 Tax=Hibiscus syriacus TaxID=106335 RepID=A0A6A2YLI7_HIBSY|nr:Detected protein of unknown function [Hibiscus syriacus]
MKRIIFVMGLLALLVSTELAVAVDGRTLPSKTVAEGGYEEQRETSVSSSAASNTSTRNWFRSLGFRLASGPSRRGPGH